MAARLFNLRNVPEDEANDIRNLLTDHGVRFYETRAGFWGISAPALWVSDTSQQTEAESIIADYQKVRSATAREEYERLRSEGNAPTWLGNIMKHPLRFILLLLLALFILYATLSPFLRIGH